MINERVLECLEYAEIKMIRKALEEHKIQTDDWNPSRYDSTDYKLLEKLIVAFSIAEGEYYDK